ATEVTETISGEMVSGKTALPDVKMVSKEEEDTEAANGRMTSCETMFIVLRFVIFTMYIVFG
nr:hypothetical protein [Tanacetum cinerariifolium]